uniref:Uncharacterized protein n=1 Tax=Oreochromis aureus TaxID=47969 RepID=A0A668V3C0_OREAU
ITRDASFNARDALISPSANCLTLARASQVASASDAMSSVALSFPRLFLQSWKHRIVQNVLLS